MDTCEGAGGLCGRTGGFVGAVGAFYVALQLERRGILSVTVLTRRVTLPTLTVLLLQLQMMLHVIHEPEKEVGQIQQKGIRTNQKAARKEKEFENELQEDVRKTGNEKKNNTTHKERRKRNRSKAREHWKRVREEGSRWRKTPPHHRDSIRAVCAV